VAAYHQRYLTFDISAISDVPFLTPLAGRLDLRGLCVTGQVREVGQDGGPLSCGFDMIHTSERITPRSKL